jgi:hypothetical protein
MAPEIAELLRNLPWARDGSRETEQLLRDIVGAQIPRLEVGQERVQDVTQLLQILNQQGWYRDGLDPDEKVALAGIFRTFSSLQLGRINTETGRPVYPFLNEYHIPALYASAIEDRRFVLTRPDANPLTILALADVGYEAKAAEALEHARIYIADIVRLAGAVKSTTVVIIVEPDLNVCGRAYQEIFATQIRPDCVSSNVVVHELTHLATPVVLAAWFEEGTAYWVEQHLTTGLIDRPLLQSPQMRWETTFDRWCCDSNDDDDYTATVRGAVAFWYDLELLIGAEAVGNAIKAVPEGVALEAIPAILRFTPAEKQAAVRSLITERCRVGSSTRTTPCTISTR